jgi:hypothetical protein
VTCRSKWTASLAVAVVVMTALSVATSAGKVPRKFVPVAHGALHGATWTLGVRGVRGERCFSIALREREGGSESSGCEGSRPLEGDWARITGVSTEEDGATLELELTSLRVARLELLLGQPGRGPNRPSTWKSVATRAIEPAEAERAHLDPDFRFAIVTSAGTLCVQKVRAFDRDGVLLEKLNVPCEY